MSKVARKNAAAVKENTAPPADENKNPVKAVEMMEQDANGDGAAKKKRGRASAKKDAGDEQPQLKATENLVKNVEMDKKQQTTAVNAASKPAAKEAKVPEPESVNEEPVASKKRGGGAVAAKKANSKAAAAVEEPPVDVSPPPPPPPPPAPAVPQSQSTQSTNDNAQQDEAGAKKKRGRKPSATKHIEMPTAAPVEAEPPAPSPPMATKAESGQKALTITGQTFYNKDQKKSAADSTENMDKKSTAENDTAKANKKGGAQKKEKEPVESKQDEEAVAKKKPKGRTAASNGKNGKEQEMNEEEQEPAKPASAKSTPPKTQDTIESKSTEAKTSQEVHEQDDGKKKRGRKPAAK